MSGLYIYDHIRMRIVRGHIRMRRFDSYIKNSIASQRYATPRDFAVNINSVTLRKWRHLIKSVLSYDNEGSNYRDSTSVLGHDSKGSNDRGCTSGHIYPPLTLAHPTGPVDSVFKLVYYFN